MPAYLLDTCAVIWIANNVPLHEPAASVLESTREAKLLVSSITAWEVAMLIEKRRLALSINPLNWFNRFLEATEVELTNPAISTFLSSCILPDSTINDPIDRILVATARELGHTLVTRDQNILQYANLGHLKALRC